MGFLIKRERPAPKDFEIWWPTEYPAPGSHFSADQVLGGLRKTGMTVAVADVPQSSGNVVIVELASPQGSHLIAFDHDDNPEISKDVASRVLVYFKQQYAEEGYEQPNVVPAGYTPANKRIYRYLPLLRAIRTFKLFRYDVYGRFGLQWGGQEIRREAHELLSARSDFRYEGSLFRYPGGPDKVPYGKYLLEIARAKVCVDMPGKGEFCTRLIDYLAVGACVVKPPPRARLPVRLVDGVHVVYCASDLCDLGDVCAQLVRDDEQREAIAHNARDFFDRYLHRRQLAQRFVDEVVDARAGLTRPLRAPARPRGARVLPGYRRRAGSYALTQALVILMLALSLSVGLPEALGDRPYDPRPSRVVPHVHKHSPVR